MCFSIRSLSMLSDATRIDNNSPHFYCHFVIVYSPHDAEVNVTNVDNENAKTIAQFISIAIGEKKTMWNQLELSRFGRKTQFYAGNT